MSARAIESSARRAPEPRLAALPQHHQHLDVARAPEGLGKGACPRRHRPAQDLAGRTGQDHSLPAVQAQPAAPQIEAGHRREVRALEDGEVVVGPQPLGDRARLLGRFLAVIDDDSRDPRGVQHLVQTVLVRARQRRIEPLHVAGRDQLGALRLQAQQVVVADHRQAASIPELPGPDRSCRSARARTRASRSPRRRRPRETGRSARPGPGAGPTIG